MSMIEKQDEDAAGRDETETSAGAAPIRDDELDAVVGGLMSVGGAGGGDSAVCITRTIG